MVMSVLNFVINFVGKRFDSVRTNVCKSVK